MIRDKVCNDFEKPNGKRVLFSFDKGKMYLAVLLKIKTGSSLRLFNDDNSEADLERAGKKAFIVSV
jgi:hypothetical protein